jgi:hypothetical protein
MSGKNDFLLFLYNDYVEFELSKKYNLDFFQQAERIYYKDIKDYASDPRIKIAVVQYFEEWMEPPLMQSMDLSSADLLVVYNYEDLNKDHSTIQREVTELYNNDKFCVIAGGAFINHLHPSNYFYPMLTHLRLTSEASSVIPTFENNRNYLFDALLGTPKPARKYIYYRLLEDNLLDSSLVNITAARNDWVDDFKIRGVEDISYQYELKYGPVTTYKTAYLEELDQQDGVEVNDNVFIQSIETENSFHNSIRSIVEGSNDCHSYFKRTFKIPVQCYSHSWYSIITESFQDQTFHATEKTAKALLGKRIFVMFSCQGFLKKLQQLGFKTFDSIIDESYDAVEDVGTRFNLAWQQVRYLANCTDHISNYSKVNDILEHNSNLIRDREFQLKDIEQFILNHVRN